MEKKRAIDTLIEEANKLIKDVPDPRTLTDEQLETIDAAAPFLNSDYVPPYCNEYERRQRKKTLEALKESTEASIASAQASEIANEALDRSAKAQEKTANLQKGTLFMTFLLVFATIVLGWANLNLQDIIKNQEATYNQQFIDLQNKIIGIEEKSLFRQAGLEIQFFPESLVVSGPRNIDGRITVINIGDVKIEVQPYPDIYLECRGYAAFIGQPKFREEPKSEPRILDGGDRIEYTFNLPLKEYHLGHEECALSISNITSDSVILKESKLELIKED